MAEIVTNKMLIDYCNGDTLPLPSCNSEETCKYISHCAAFLKTNGDIPYEMDETHPAYTDDEIVL